MSASAFVKHLPQQGNPTEDDRVSRAPYNFVPLPERVVRAVDEAGELPDHDRFSPEGYPHSGWFEVRLTTETPLFIRAPLRSQQFAKPDENNPDYTKRTKNTPNFFHRGEITEPVIPGSSLRGMLRSLIEVIGYGKLTQVTERGMIYRAVGDTSSLGGAYRDQTLGPNKKLAATLHFDYPSSHLQGGYLCRYQGDWAIRPARRDAATFDESIIRVPFEQLGQLRSASRGNHKVHPIWVKPARREDHPRGNGGLVLTMTETPASIEHRDPQDRSDNKDGKLSAWLIESGVLSGKKAQYAIFAPDQNAKAIPIPHDMWEHYTDDRDLTRGSDERASRPLGKDKELLAGDGDPLFYLVDAKGKLAFFGPTMMFRLPYKRTPKDLIPAPLRQPLDIDLADALFGYIRSNTDFEEANLERPRQGDKAWAYAGRLSVSDAQLAPDENTDDLFLEPLTPRILGTPKPTTFQHYLVQGADASKHVRTPEDAIRASREALEKVNLSHYDSPSRDMNERECGQRTVLRGTKRYWHQGPRTTAQLAEHPSKLKLDSKQHTRMRPIAPTKSFVFRVRFDNLSDIELGALCWALHPRGHQGKEYRHQLGMGKPLGMGSIRLDAQLHLISRSTRYQSLFATDGNHWQQGEQQRPCPVASDTVAGWIDQFEQHLLAQLNAPKDCQRLADLRRIGALLRLMEWPGPQTEQTQTWEITADRDSWTPWKDRRVLPPVWAKAFGERFASKGEPQSPTQADQVFDWAIESTVNEQDPVADVVPGQKVDDVEKSIKVALFGKQEINHAPEPQPISQAPNASHDIDSMLQEIPSWTEKQLAQQLGKDKNKTLKSFADNEQQLLESLRIHQALLLEWENNADKNKKKAAKTYQELIGRHDQA